jgi:general L-amino acid transport system permease protein
LRFGRFNWKILILCDENPLERCRAIEQLRITRTAVAVFLCRQRIDASSLYPTPGTGTRLPSIDAGNWTIGGVARRLPAVNVAQVTALMGWGTLLIAFPIGLLVALGRRSTLPVVRGTCAAYVEFFRGAPLVTLLFMGFYVLGFFLPPGVTAPDRITRALIIFILFTSAYVAEIVRGGLQGIPRGQWEAAQALGLSPWKQVRLVILPQALRSVIPALVGQAISLFKDTPLVFIIGVPELLRIARAITSQERFLGQGLFAETLVFAALIYWVGSYWMSRESQRLEKRLGVGER